MYSYIYTYNMYTHLYSIYTCITYTYIYIYIRIHTYTPNETRGWATVLKSERDEMPRTGNIYIYILREKREWRKRDRESEEQSARSERQHQSWEYV